MRIYFFFRIFRGGAEIELAQEHIATMADWREQYVYVAMAAMFGT
jgi:hypothetical protein